MLSLVQHLGPEALPQGNALSLAYAALDRRALDFYTHEPSTLGAAVGSRSSPEYPRRDLARILGEYNAALGASRASLDAAASIADPRALCVVTGQQAGFVGGPLYTCYKIATALRVARELRAATSRPVVPVFWLASEDHDFQEINHAFALGEGGALRRVSFGWSGAGRPVSDLPITPEVRRAITRYVAETDGMPESGSLGRLLCPEPEDSYCSWIARLFHRLFGEQGLVVVEPRLLAPLAGGFFAQAFERAPSIRERLHDVASRLEAREFQAALDPDQAGVPFRFTPEGMRVRAEADSGSADLARREPSSFSADAALRPVLQDVLLPTAVSVLGPGEIAYQAMLRPLYELFGVPQPLLLPRLSLAVMTQEEAGLMERSRLGYAELLERDFRIAPVLAQAVPESDRSVFDELRREIETAMARAAEHAGSLDPNLAITARKTLESCLRSMGRLEERSYRARLARSGVSTRALLELRSALAPRGSPQERIFPAAFLLRRHGDEALAELPGLADPLDFRHHVAVAPSRLGQGSGA